MVSDYISRDVAIEAMYKDAEANPNHTFWASQYEALMDIPAADVREVVTCGKCKFGKYTGTEWLCDKHSGHADKLGEDASYHEYHSKYWFCADGERRKHGEV